MSFPYLILWFTRCTWNQKYKPLKSRIPENSGKEEEFDFSRNIFNSCTAEKASAFTSFGRKGSATVEAIICIPIFLYASIALIWLLETRSIQITIRNGMQAVGKELAETASYQPVLWETDFERELIECIGKKRLEQSTIRGGAEGFDCSESFSVPGSGIYELRTKFFVKLPVPYFVLYGLECEEYMRIKGWNGYEKELFPDLSMDKVVYVTETGVVYHLDYHCTYLEPSVRSVAAEGIANLRNESGGKYYQCPLCVNKNDTYENVYITNYGSRYHVSTECSGIRRYIQEVRLSEVKGRVACSKCGK